MCGLVGAVGTLWQTDRQVFKQLLYLDAFRGEHSTGIAVVTDANVVMTDKEVGHPFYLLQNGGKNHSFLGDDGVIKNADVRVVIGHNRYATTGKIVAENAHPFTQGSITGAHNGTLERAYLNKLDDAKKFDVDSEAIFHNLNIHGTDAIAKIAGAYALTWYDQKQKAMFFIRNKDRPLFYTRRTDKDAIFWASEKWMLEVTLSRKTVSHDEIKEFTADHLYKINMDYKTQLDFKKTELEDLGIFKGFLVPSVTYTNGHQNGKNMHPGMGGTKNWWSGEGNPFAENLKFKSDDIKTPAGWSLDKLRKLVGLPLQFTIVGSSIGVSGVEYIKARSTVPTDDFEIRIHAQPKELWDKLIDSKAKWVGTAKRPVKYFKKGKNELYLLLDMRTIAPAPTAKDMVANLKKGLKATTPLKVVPSDTTSEEEPLDGFPEIFDSNVPIQGFQGRYLDPSEWYRCTANGCAWCSADAVIHEHHTLTWVGHDEFVCQECKEYPEVDQWLKTK